MMLCSFSLVVVGCGYFATLLGCCCRRAFEPLYIFLVFAPGSEGAASAASDGGKCNRDLTAEGATLDPPGNWRSERDVRISGHDGSNSNTFSQDIRT